MAQQNPDFLPLNLVAVVTLLFLGFLYARPFADEGIFLSGGWMTAQGLLPYRDFFDIHSPGLFFVLASLYKLFGAGLEGSRLLVLGVNAATLLAIYVLGRKMFDQRVAALAMVLHAVWLPVFHGFWAVIEPFTAFASTLAVLALHRVLVERQRQPGDLAFAGLALGLNLIFKQTNFPFVAGMLGVLAAYTFVTGRWKQVKPGQALAAFAGLAVLPALALAPFALTGSLPALIRQTIAYPLANAGLLSNTVAKPEYVIVPVLLLFFTPLGFYWGLRKGWHWVDDACWQRLLLLAWLVLSLPNLFPWVGCCHHLEPLSPAAALISAGVVVKMKDKGFKRMLAVSLAALALVGLLSGYVALRDFGKDEFKGARELAAFVQARAAPQDRVFVFNDNPEIYFLAQRLPSSKYLYYPYLSPQGFADLQRELRGELEADPPKLVVDFSGNGEPLNPDGKAEAEQWVLDHYTKTKEVYFDPAYDDYYHYAYVYERKAN